MSCCKSDSSFKKRYIRLLNEMPLASFEKELIKERFVNLVTTTESDYRRTATLFVILTNMVSVSSVFIAILVTVDKASIADCRDTLASEILFWFVLGLSISLALANKWLYSFNIHKKYIVNKDFLEKFYSEGWMFMAGNGKYKECKGYTERYKLFCLRVEQLRMKSVKTVNDLEAESAELLAAGTSKPITDEVSDSQRKHVRRSRKIRQITNTRGSNSYSTRSEGSQSSVSKNNSEVVIDIRDSANSTL